MNYPNLYDAKSIYKGNIPEHDGIGTLSDAESCIVTMASNNTFVLDLTYPVNGKYADSLVEESLLRVNLDRLNHGKKYRQFFRITERNGQMTAKDEVIKIHAEHLSYDLKWKWCKPVNLETKNIAACVEHLRTEGLETDPFEYLLKTVPVPDDFKKFWHKELFTKREGALEIAELFGLYIIPDNLSIQFILGGTDTGLILKKGKNLIDLSVLEESDQRINGVYVYYQDDKETTLPILVAPYKGEYGVPHYTAFNYAGSHPEGEFEEPADDSIVKLIGEAYLRNNTQARTGLSYSAKIADTGQNISLYDIVEVIHSGFKVDQKMEVQQIAYDVLRQRYNEIVVGDYKIPISQLIANLQIKAKG